jgi:hypothetical protein
MAAMSNPYRSGAAAPAPAARVVVKDQERPPLRAIRIRAFSDGTTALRFRRKRSIFVLGFCWVWGCAMLALTAIFLEPLFVGEVRYADESAATSTIVFTLMMSIACLAIATGHLISGERIIMTPSGLVRRRGVLGRSDVATLDEVSTVVVTGDAGRVRVDVQLGRRRLPILEELGYSESQLRWCVQRLRQALDSARAARSA